MSCDGLRKRLVQSNLAIFHGYSGTRTRLPLSSPVPSPLDFNLQVPLHQWGCRGARGTQAIAEQPGREGYLYMWASILGSSLIRVGMGHALAPLGTLGPYRSNLRAGLLRCQAQWQRPGWPSCAKTPSLQERKWHQARPGWLLKRWAGRLEQGPRCVAFRGWQL